MIHETNFEVKRGTNQRNEVNLKLNLYLYNVFIRRTRLDPRVEYYRLQGKCPSTGVQVMIVTNVQTLYFRYDLFGCDYFRMFYIDTTLHQDYLRTSH